MSQEREEIIGRLDSFLEKMKSRFLESEEFAEEALLEQLESTDYDMHQVSITNKDIKSQLRNLIEKNRGHLAQSDIR